METIERCRECGQPQHPGETLSDGRQLRTCPNLPDHWALLDGEIVTVTPAPRCGVQAWQPHTDPHCPPDPPSPVCRLAPGHDGPHEGRSVPHGTPLEWTETNGRVTRG